MSTKRQLEPDCTEENLEQPAVERKPMLPPNTKLMIPGMYLPEDSITLKHVMDMLYAEQTFRAWS